MKKQSPFQQKINKLKTKQTKKQAKKRTKTTKNNIAVTHQKASIVFM